MRRLVVALGSAAFLGILSAPAHAGGPAVAPRPHAVVAAGQAQAVPMISGIAYLPGVVNLQPTASGTWVNAPLQVTLPLPGTYLLDANVHGRIWGRPPVNVVILARLVNVTTGTVVPNSVRLIDHLVDDNRGAAMVGIRATEPISEHINVTEPTTIQLQVTRINQGGASTIAEIRSDAGGYTSLRYARV